ncbi:hypothetical protein ColTof3_14553 [Colletotrichum tofieldiae]|nr:hypothetical protein ColTof3_14553 [Colletotrichum tofieldiae]GKT97309.1 hypothetical protein Ct61P_15159 [Colletotrichum tofieldiae]
MPVIINEVNGKLLRPKVLANTKQLAREIGGLIRETSAFTSTYKPIAPFRILDVPTGEYTLSSKDEKSIKVEFMTGAMTTYRENLEQGLIRNMANFKHHYPSKPVAPIKMPRGKMHNGTPRLWEMELLSMLMKYMTLNGNDAMDNICSACSALPFFYDCRLPKPASRLAQIS